ncbi:carboxypeptidase B isoform X2 [Nematostella vectensis]|uniref:carboxypeptidase B isoform X2 n=1 Tax=Nematostella vectensis TaxID=45351 RepID=UPI002077081E|nr:carboxypeptidase B isoform X2 [Nematostella vectensis]
MSFVVVTALLLSATITVSNGGPFSGDRVVRVRPANDNHVTLLSGLEESQPFNVDFWTFPSNPGKTVDIHVGARDFYTLKAWLHSQGMEFTSRDLQGIASQAVNAQKQQTFADRPGNLAWFKKYHQHDEIIAELKRIAKGAKNRTQLLSIGNSYEKREQLVIRINGTNGKYKADKPVFFVNCGIHAREWVSPATCMYIIHELVSKYEKDAKVTSVLDKMDFIIHPMVNPDGYVFTHKNESNRLWRKSRKPTSKAGCIGADLNRNFGYQWGKPGSSDKPCSFIYRGEAPYSEVEVKNMAAFLWKLAPNLKGYLDIHSYGQLWMYPWGYTNQSTQVEKEMMRVANKSAIAMIAATPDHAEYKTGQSSKLLYPTSGSTKDFTFGMLNVTYSYVVELRDKRPGYGFLLPPEQILPTAREMLAGLLTCVTEIRL